MPLIDPEDYPTTPRGYRHPPDDVGGVNVANDVPADVTRLAEDVDADVSAVAAAAAGAASGVADDLADHEGASVNVHGIPDTSALVTTARTVSAGAGLTGGGTLAADRTIGIAVGGVGSTHLADGAVTSGKIADASIVDADVSASAGIARTKVDGTPPPGSRIIAAGVGLAGGGDLSADRTLSVATGGITPIHVGGGYRTIAAATTITADDFLIDVSAGTFTQPLPAAAAAGAGRRYLLRNSGSGTLTVTGPPAPVVIPGVGHVEVVSTGSTWLVLGGAYTRSVVGMESWAWNHDTPGWRLVAYDSGLRNIAALLSNVNQTVNVAQVGRSNRMVEFWLDVTVNTGVSGLAILGALPDGFRPQITANHDSNITDILGTTTVSFVLRQSGIGVQRLGAPADGSRFRGFWSFRSETALPASLPGTAITAPS